MAVMGSVAPNRTGDSGVRNLRLALGILWLLDGALQFQPYMFTRGFVNDVIVPAARGNAAFVAQPAIHVARLIAPGIAGWNAGFATVQVLLGVGIVGGTVTRRGAVLRFALAGSIVWSALVWWLSEGLGGVFTGASPLAGAPGAVFLYGVAAVVLWPGLSDRGDPLSAPLLRGTIARRTWLGLWTFSGFLLLEPSNQGRGALSSLVRQAAAGEPGVVHRLLTAVAGSLSGAGSWADTAMAIAMIAIGAGAVFGHHKRLFLVLAIGFGASIWVFGEGFGGILTGQGTDPNSGPLWMLLAMCMWVGLRPGAEVSPRTTFSPDHPALRTQTVATPGLHG
jgi:hypothetical protein